MKARIHYPNPYLALYRQFKTMSYSEGIHSPADKRFPWKEKAQKVLPFWKQGGEHIFGYQMLSDAISVLDTSQPQNSNI